MFVFAHIILLNLFPFLCIVCLGWFPQQFGGTYFHAQADTLVWGLTEDIELKMDLESRELRYRSSSRMGQWDWDVENLRYNQFVKMLKKNV